MFLNILGVLGYFGYTWVFAVFLDILGIRGYFGCDVDILDILGKTNVGSQCK